MIAYDIKIEWDEDGCHLIIDGDSPDPAWTASILDFRVEDPEQLYDRVKAAIGPWLYEKEQAYQEFKAAVAAGAFRCVDPEGEWIAEQARVVAIREDGSYRVEPDEDAYDPTDPKHPRFHSIHSEIYDNREGK